MPRFSLKHLFIGIAIASFGMALIPLSRYLDPFDDIEFTPSAWAKAERQTRARMSRDLVYVHF
jgi:hypothetical protein